MSNRREGAYRYQQLENWLLKGIQQQRWQLGERLPSIRDLCRQHGVAKITVQHALQRLEAQGLLEARPKSGYFVTLQAAADEPPATQSVIEAPRPASVSEMLQDIMRRSAAFDILPALQAGDLPPGIVSLNRSVGRALRRQRGNDFQYYDAPAGDDGLREQLARHQQRRGWPVSAAELCMTSGCQHSLFLALQACCRPGDVVAVESPGFYGVLQLLQQLGLQVVEVPSALSSGLDCDALEQVLQRWKVSACIVSPAFSTPAGALLPEASRQRLLALAEAYDLALIEDDIYADTAFTAVPPPLKALDRSGRVILCSSFSKSLSRDLRLGWIAGGRWHERIIQLKLVTQLASSRFLQRGVADFIRDGSFAAHLRRQRQQLRSQRDQLLALLRGWSGVVRVSAPLGGLALWLELAPGTDVSATYGRALDQGIVITPGPLFSASGQYAHCLRISFAHPWTDARTRALNSLGQLLGCR